MSISRETIVRTFKRFLGRKSVIPAHRSTSVLKVVIFGNCAAMSLAKLMQAMTGGIVATGVEASSAMIAKLRAGKSDHAAQIKTSDLIFVQEMWEVLTFIQDKYPEHFHKVRRFPFVHFPAFHPDIVYVGSQRSGNYIAGPLGQYQSAIALCGWMEGMSIKDTISLFRHEVFEALGYYEYWETSQKMMLGLGEGSGFPIADLLENWHRQGCWLYSFNHPKPFVLADMARRLLTREGIATLPDVENFVADGFATGPAWPVYPEIGKALGIEGHYLFKAIAGYGPRNKPILMLGLDDFVAHSFAVFAQHGRDDLQCERLALPRYQDLKRFVGAPLSPASITTQTPQSTGGISPSSEKRSNPYAALPDYQFWRRAIENVAPDAVDPVVRAKFPISRADRVATAGSCFAQHISSSLRAQGFHFYVAENASPLAPEEASRRQHGVFSARYGNLYTARQLIQLFDRAYAQFSPVDEHWMRDDGRFVDPFRPQVEPDGFLSPEDLADDRSTHFAAVREMFEKLDVFVFTLGLTEAWRSRIDGAVFPLAPGIVAGQMDETKYQFVNFGVNEVIADMQLFIERLRHVNAKARLIMTVSPVPLIATFEDRHVLVSTTLSKSVLRTAADVITRRDPLSDYFPSYEIITGSYARGRYFESDLRSVTPTGVGHVMRLFFQHFADADSSSILAAEIARESATVREVICDEEAMDK